MSIRSRVGHKSHVQNTPSDAWEIEHKFGFYPSVSVFLNVQGKQETILPHSVEHPSVNKTIIRFTRPRIGEARLV